jgi:co-chaperonin GroES (HSP10)
MKSTGNRVFIEIDWSADNMAGRFHLPQVRNRDLPNVGRVLVAPKDAEFKKGDHVVFDRFKQQLVEIDGKTVTIVKAEHVAAVIE